MIKVKKPWNLVYLQILFRNFTEHFKQKKKGEESEPVS